MSTAPLRNLFDPHTFAFETGLAFRGISITPNSEGYNIILRAYDGPDKGLYVMSHADNPLEGLWRLWEAVTRGNGRTAWNNDKFFSKGG